MQGEYRGDFTRDTFQRANHFCRVLMQQGRVQLDADWNEQGAILLYFLRHLARDLIGPHGGPRLIPGGAAAGFALQPLAGPPQDLTIGAGHYYVDGILCELEARAANPNGLIPPAATYLNQPNLPNPPPVGLTTNALVYLDVWERHLVSAQQDSIREVALGGPDTASRAQVVWQLKLATMPPGNQGWPQADPAQANKFFTATWPLWTALWQPSFRGLLQAQVPPSPAATDPCVISPRSSYRGTENQLYRVEIQTGGLFSAATPPTFKWSRENGSVVFPILKLGTGGGQTTVTLANLGRDSRLSLEVNDWVEVVDDVSSLTGGPRPLLQVQAVDRAGLTVTLAGTASITVDATLANHPLLRRWDQQAGDPAQGGLQIQDGDGAALIVEGVWLDLEDGIQIRFQPGANYRSGDYWLIPARVAKGNIEWPQQADSQGNLAPQALPPHGIEHHYAPIGFFPPGVPTVIDLRHAFGPLAT